MTPFARLLSQTEFNFAEMSRRAVENATAPLKARGQEILADTVESVTTTARRFLIKAGFALAAGLLLLVAVIFAFAALYHELFHLIGVIPALLVMAGIFIVLALLAIAAMTIWPSGKARSATRASLEREHARLAMAEASRRMAAEQAQAYETIAKSSAAADPNEGEQALNSGLEAIVTALGDAGFAREQAGLKAGLTIAQKLRPMQAVSLALLAGFVVGTRIIPRRP